MLWLHKCLLGILKQSCLASKAGGPMSHRPHHQGLHTAGVVPVQVTAFPGCTLHTWMLSHPLLCCVCGQVSPTAVLCAAFTSPPVAGLWAPPLCHTAQHSGLSWHTGLCCALLHCSISLGQRNTEQPREGRELPRPPEAAGESPVDKAGSSWVGAWGATC